MPVIWWSFFAGRGNVNPDDLARTAALPKKNLELLKFHNNSRKNIVSCGRIGNLKKDYGKIQGI
jgi:hypothetical protein